MKIVELAAWLLSKQVIGDAKSQLFVFMQGFDHLIVFRIVLKAASGVYAACQAQAIEFAHEMARGIELVGQESFGPLAKVA